MDADAPDTLAAWRERADNLLDRVLEDSDPRLSEQAVADARDLAEQTSDADDLGRLASGLILHWELTRTEASFREAISLFELMAEATTDGAARTARLLAWRRRAELDPSRDTLDMVLAELSADADDDGVGSEAYDYVVMSRYYAAYLRTDLEAAVHRIRARIRRAAPDGEQAAALQAQLASLLCDRYDADGNSQDLFDSVGELISGWAARDLEHPPAALDAVIRAAEPAVPRLTRSRQPVVAMPLYSLALRRFNRDQTEENGTVMVQMAAALGASFPPFMPMHANALMARFKALGDPADLDAAIAVMESLPEKTASDGTSRLALADSMLWRYARSGVVEDWFRAFQAMDSDEILTVEEPRVRMGYAYNALVLGEIGRSLAPGLPTAATARLVAILDRARSLTDHWEEERALDIIAGHILDAAPLSDVMDADLGAMAAAGRAEELDVTRRLTTSATSHLTLRQWDHRLARGPGNRDVSSRIVAAVLRATALLEPRDVVSKVRLVSVLFSRVAETSDERDLTECVGLADAVLPRIMGRCLRGIVLSDLAGALASRHNVGGDLGDLDRSIATMRDSVMVTTADSPWFRDRLVYLSEKLAHRFELRGARRDLDESIEQIERALAAVDDDTPAATRISVHNGVAGAYRRRFRLDRDADDLVRAVQALRDALTLVSDPTQRMYATVHHNLASCLLQMDSEGDDAVDLTEVVTHFRMALDATPSIHPQRLDRHAMLARALARRARTEAAEESDRTEALAILRDVVTHYGADEPLRYEAVLSLAQLLADDPATAADVTELCREIVRSTLPSALTRFNAGIVWTHVAERHATPEEALDAWDEVVDLLEIAAPKDLPRADQERAVEQFQDLASSAASFAVAAGQPERAVGYLERGRLLLWRQTTADVPAAEGDGFRLDDLIARLGRRLVIVVVVKAWRCDAILVSAGGVRVVELPDLRYDDLVRRCGEFLDLLHEYERGGAADASGRLWPLLGWLWQSVARPVLDAIPPGAGRHRLIWCPTGLLSLLPLHAAHDRAGASGLADVAICSYVPSLTALARSLARPAPAGTIEDLLTIAVEEHRAAQPLPHVRAEVAAVMEAVPEARHSSFLNLRATRRTVLDELGRHRFLHIASHGLHNGLDPAAGGIALADGVLTVLDLAAAHRDDAELAYLSACRTATTGARLADESIHLGTALFLSGFRAVVGTMWAVADAIAARAARAFYLRLRTGGAADTAAALADAVDQLRARYPDEPLLWAGFVHIGGSHGDPGLD
ncbi:CHAT domain-containing protein [Actinoplanes sp. NPDC051470]|uniref:CHAT domain-containing protein n=1 Tax=Actinoplanes sp. NPDC051470 TaxID=3157224 RepID=UPI003441283A